VWCLVVRFVGLVGGCGMVGGWWVGFVVLVSRWFWWLCGIVLEGCRGFCFCVLFVAFFGLFRCLFLLFLFFVDCGVWFVFLFAGWGCIGFFCFVFGWFLGLLVLFLWVVVSFWLFVECGLVCCFLLGLFGWLLGWCVVVRCFCGGCF